MKSALKVIKYRNPNLNLRLIKNMPIILSATLLL